MNKENNLTLIIVGLVIGLIIGYGIGVLSNFQVGPGHEQINEEQINEEQIRKDFVQELRDKGLLTPEPETIKEISGAIEKIGKKQFTLNVSQRYDDPLNELLPSTIIVKVTDQTKIVQIREKSLEVLNQEEQEFQEKLSQYEEQGEEVPTTLSPPQLYTEEQIKLSQLEQEDQVTVVAHKNVKGKSEFEAKTIKKEVRPEAEKAPIE